MIKKSYHLPPVCDRKETAGDREVHQLSPHPSLAISSSSSASYCVESAANQWDGIGSYGQIFHTARHLRSQESGLGELESLLHDSMLTDILINGRGEVYGDRGQGLQRLAIDWLHTIHPPANIKNTGTIGAVRQFAMTLAHKCGVRLDDAQPWADGVLEISPHISVRFHAIIAPLAVDGGCISLRIIRPSLASLTELLQRETIAPAAYQLLLHAIDQRENIIICGATGSGKTTLLQAIIASLPLRERIITLEDSPELPLMHPHHIRLITKKSNTEGVGEIPLQILLQQSLRMRPDRIYLGEVRGGEITDLLHSFNTGHQGGGATLHANSVYEIPARILALGMLSGYEMATINALLATVKIMCIHIHKIPAGNRKIFQIARLYEGKIDQLWSA